MNKKLLLSVLSTGLLATTVLPVAQARDLSDAERASVVKKPTVTNPYDKRVNPVKKPIVPTKVKPEEPKKPVAGTPISNSRNPLNLPKGPIAIRTNGNGARVTVPGVVRRYTAPQYRMLNEWEAPSVPRKAKAVNPYDSRINPPLKPIVPTKVKPEEPKKPVAGTPISNSRNPLNLPKGPITVRTNGNAGNVAVPGGVRRYETPQYRTLNELERRTFAPGVTKAVNPYKTRINPVKKPVAPTEVKPVEQKKPVAGKAVSNSRNPLNLSKGPITIKR